VDSVFSHFCATVGRFTREGKASTTTPCPCDWPVGTPTLGRKARNAVLIFDSTAPGTDDTPDSNR
jgi:hypothetical protein